MGLVLTSAGVLGLQAPNLRVRVVPFEQLEQSTECRHPLRPVSFTDADDAHDGVSMRKYGSPDGLRDGAVVAVSELPCGSEGLLVENQRGPARHAVV